VYGKPGVPVLGDFRLDRNVLLEVRDSLVVARLCGFQHGNPVPRA